MNIIFKPYLPEFLIYLFIGITLLLSINLYGKLSKSLFLPQKITLLFLRICVILCIGLILLNPCKAKKQEEKKSEPKIVLAIDLSKSMNQIDMDKSSRIDYVKSVFKKIKWLEMKKVNDIKIEHYSFADNANSILPENIITLAADGKSTNLNTIIKTITSDTNHTQDCKGIILFTDGRDHSNKAPELIANLAEAKNIPIYSFPVGNQGYLRDVEVNIKSMNSFCFINQPFIIESEIQTIGCQYENLKIKLFRNDIQVDSLILNTKDLNTNPISFKVSEEKPGTFTYKISVAPIHDEHDITNNESITFLKVVDKKIKILLLEGSPHWDTTFLQRSLQRNPKLELDSIIQYAPKRVHQSRQTVGQKILQIPSTTEEFSFYDVIILGKNINDMLSSNQIAQLSDYIQRSGGIVLTFRGNSFNQKELPDFMPGLWSTEISKFDINIEDEGDLDYFGPIEYLKTLFKENGGPKIDGVYTNTQKKTLTSSLIPFFNQKKEIVPGAIYRRHGNGQVLSLGISGSWHWAFHANTDIELKETDLFWEHCLMWLESKSNFRPGENFFFTGNTVTMNAGKPFDFFLTCKQPLSATVIPKITILNKSKALAEIQMTSKNNQDYNASFVPPERGAYKAILELENQKLEFPFVIHGLNVEEKEVSADINKLTELAKLTNGKILNITSLENLPDEIKAENFDVQKTEEYYSIWDTGFLFFLMTVLFSLDWFYRRRWGLL
jgi:hypothetical protein